MEDPVMIKTFLTILLLGFLLVGCAGKNVRPYTPPAECVQNEDGSYNGYLLNKIAATGLSPRQISLIFQMANIGLLEDEKIDPDKILKFIHDTRIHVQYGVTYITLASFVRKSVGNYSMTIALLSDFIYEFDSDDVIDPCDKALILKHLDDQEIQVLKYKALNPKV
jgi:hypothetical protein